MSNQEHHSHWTFLTNFAHILICIAEDPEIRICDLASKVGITQRAVQLILHELEEDGYITRERSGRRNRYHLNDTKPLRHPIENHCRIRDLIAFVADQKKNQKGRKAHKNEK